MGKVVSMPRRVEWGGKKEQQAEGAAEQQQAEGTTGQRGGRGRGKGRGKGRGRGRVKGDGGVDIQQLEGGAFFITFTAT